MYRRKQDEIANVVMFSTNLQYTVERIQSQWQLKKNRRIGV
jgi:hypothetical protein